MAKAFIADRTAKQDAALEFLSRELKQGPRQARDIVKRAQERGITQLRWALKTLEVTETIERGRKIWTL